MTVVSLLRPVLPRLLACAVLLSLPATGWSFGDVSFMPPDDYSQRWSLAITGRTQVSPYVDKDVQSDLTPLITYSGETLFLAGTKAGIHLFRNEDWRLNTYVAYRFGGYNRKTSGYLIGMERDNGIDAGIDLTRITPLGDFTLDITSDIASKSSGEVISLYWSRNYQHGRWKVLPWVGGSWYSSDFNRYYFGVESNEVLPERPEYHGSSSFNFRTGSDIRFRIDSVQYVTFNLEYERLGSAIYHSPLVDERNIFKLGINYRLEFDDEDILPGNSHYDFLNTKRRPWSYRVAFGTGSSAKLNELIRGANIDFDDTENKLVSFFAGKQLMRSFLGSSWEIWGNLGMVYRLEEPEQSNFFEYIAAIKFVYSNFPWSDKVLTRFGAAEGISYADKIPYSETTKKDADNKGTSHLLNYLDFSLDVSLGDVFRAPSLRHCFGGYSVHHRSGIFASADIYGPTYGGSNVNSLYVECLYN